MAIRQITIRNENGIHCRPSAVIIKAVQPYADHHIAVTRGDQVCDPRSILALMSLGLAKGEEASIEVVGPDEERIIDELAELFERQFDFPQQAAAADSQ